MFALFCAIAAILYGVISIKWILGLSTGSEKMQQHRRCHSGRRIGLSEPAIHHHRMVGAALVRRHLVSHSAGKLPSAFAIGALLSGLTGYIGMNVSVRANVRTAEAAKSGLNAALNVAFKGGAITGMLVVGLGLLGVAGYYALPHQHGRDHYRKRHMPWWALVSAVR